MRMVPEAESLTVEFKSDIKKFPDSEIFEAVVAFANTDGGDLYLGIEDDGRITGVNPAHNNPITLAALVANNTIPPLPIRAEIIDDEAPVLKISVTKAYSGIAATSSGKVLRRRLKADGKPENVPMYPTEMATRLSDLRLLDYSAMPLYEASRGDFDALEIDRLKRLLLAYDGDKVLLELADEDLFKALGFVKDLNGTLYPTITGILMIGKVASIKRFVPTGSASFQMLEGTNVRINEDFVLPILSTIEKINSYLEAWNPAREIEVGLFRMSAPEFDKRAIREALVNAFSHRDYSKMGRVRVAISDDGLTIANPGGFVEGVSVKNLLTAEPHGRNPMLADVLKRVGLAEKTGRGIDRIFEGSLIYGRQLPDYSASTSVTVSLFIPRCAPDPQFTRLVSDEQHRLGRQLPVNTLLVFNALKENPRSDVQQLASITHLSATMIQTILDQNMASGMVEVLTNGRGSNKYSLSAQVYSVGARNRGYVRPNDSEEMRYAELVIDMAQRNAFIAKADVVQLLHVSENEAYNILKKLVNDGVLKTVNKGRYSKYALK